MIHLCHLLRRVVPQCHHLFIMGRLRRGHRLRFCPHSLTALLLSPSPPLHLPDVHQRAAYQHTWVQYKMVEFPSNSHYD